MMFLDGRFTAFSFAPARKPHKKKCIFFTHFRIFFLCSFSDKPTLRRATKLKQKNSQTFNRTDNRIATVKRFHPVTLSPLKLIPTGQRPYELTCTYFLHFNRLCRSGCNGQVLILNNVYYNCNFLAVFLINMILKLKNLT